ncbi:hypothetical protein HLH33_17710 [Gluconacetobacter diazotrophicus]|uniref:Uncharacterized protein n=1 Tax=Gluconacetobacter diazotrophicus TaxID=33996 RepID=A0A7W4I878_GLUDI|nr:hypothetical protein [Gluconacetobacter diazotrophicus]MBB2158109.1 hypothetical protein [Gluconacetobacter diazotrophicus]
MTRPASSVFAGCEHGCRVRVTLSDDRRIEGEYQLFGGHRMLIMRDPAAPLGLRVEGPLQRGDVRDVEILQSRDEVREEWRARRLGKPVFTWQPTTRQDIRAQLEGIARAIAAVPKDGDVFRRLELEAQFTDLAARIALGEAKRAWVLAEARWYRSHNHPPSMVDLWGEDIASPSCFRRPRDQDFDPDPVVRNRPSQVPAWVLSDPHSIRNMLAALTEAGLAARVHRLGDPPHERGAILVKMPVNGRAQFALNGRRTAGGTMTWTQAWDVLDTETGNRRLRAVQRSPAYRTMLRVLREGRTTLQLDLATLLEPA